MLATLLGTNRIRAEGAPGPADPYWYGEAGVASASGERVTAESALRLAAVYACVRVLAETLAQLPLFLYERLPDGSKQEASSLPLYEVLHDRPNGWQTSFEWREMMMGHLSLRGNALAIIAPGLRGSVSDLLPLHPDRVEIERLVNGRLRYTVRNPGESAERYSQDEILHVRGLSSDGMVGLSPITILANAFGAAQGMESYTGAFFANMAQPGGILTSPNKLNQQARDQNKAAWQGAVAGRKRFSTAVLDNALAWTKVGVDNKDAQLLEVRQFSITEIARGFRIPPHMIGDLSRATFSNIEHQSLEFVIFTMMPWLKRWEQAIQRDLIRDRRYFAEFQLAGLVRGDLKTRYDAYAVGRSGGWLSPNDIRRLENMNPREGGDVYQEQPLGSLPSSQPPQEPNGNMDAFVEDAAERLAKAEHSEVKKRVGKAAADETRFAQWAAEFYAEQRAYIGKVLTPLLRSARMKADGVSLVGAIAASGKATVLSGDPVAATLGWPDARRKEIHSLIQEALNHERA